MNKYISNPLRCASLAALALSIYNCGGERELPAMIIPTSDWQATTTIADIKAKYYDPDGYTYTDQTPIGLTDDGEDMIIQARVISSDKTGNIFKHIFVADETGAIQININAYDLYESYQFGQEIFVNLTGLYAGGYGRLLQIGGYSGSTSSPARLETDEMEEHAQCNGLGQPSMVDTLTVALDMLKTATYGTENWFKYQSQLVRVNNVYFEKAGQATLSTAGSSGVSQKLIGEDGNSVVLYTSGYSDEEMYNMICPLGTGDVVGILSFYNAAWQLVLIDNDGLIGFTPVYEIEKEDLPAPAGSGTVSDPYNVAMALQLCENGSYTSDKVYVKGIISQIDELSTSYGNATYHISDTGSTSTQFEIYRGYSLNGDKFASEDEIKVGDAVVVYGTLTMYGSTPEMTTGSSIYSLNGKTSL